MFGDVVAYFKTMWKLHKVVCGNTAFFISAITLDDSRARIDLYNFSYNCKRDFVEHMRSIIKHEVLDYEGSDNHNCTFTKD